jgi:hypothetical protein
VAQVRERWESRDGARLAAVAAIHRTQLPHSWSEVTNLYESWSDRLATLRTGVFGAPRATLARAASTSCSYRLPNAQGIGTIVFTVSGRDNSRLFCSTFNVV